MQSFAEVVRNSTKSKRPERPSKAKAVSSVFIPDKIQIQLVPSTMQTTQINLSDGYKPDNRSLSDAPDNGDIHPPQLNHHHSHRANLKEDDSGWSGCYDDDDRNVHSSSPTPSTSSSSSSSPDMAAAKSSAAASRKQPVVTSEKEVTKHRKSKSKNASQYQAKFDNSRNHVRSKSLKEYSNHKNCKNFSAGGQGHAKLDNVEQKTQKEENEGSDIKQKNGKKLASHVKSSSDSSSKENTVLNNLNAKDCAIINGSSGGGANSKHANNILNNSTNKNERRFSRKLGHRMSNR